MVKYGVLVLAAGSSSRLGRPKQLLKIGNTTLIDHVIKQTLVLPSSCTMMITGAADMEIRNAVKDEGVAIYYNADWATGMGSSIAAGVQRLLDVVPTMEACIILVSDQPFVNSELLNLIINTFEAGNASIVASHYGNTLGTPVLFDRQHFHELKTLNGKGGAKRIIQKYQTNVTAIDFPKGEIDIDTEADYLTFISGQ